MSPSSDITTNFFDFSWSGGERNAERMMHKLQRLRKCGCCRAAQDVYEQSSKLYITACTAAASRPPSS